VKILIDNQFARNFYFGTMKSSCLVDMPITVIGFSTSFDFPDCTTTTAAAATTTTTNGVNPIGCYSIHGSNILLVAIANVAFALKVLFKTQLAHNFHLDTAKSLSFVDVPTKVANNSKSSCIFFDSLGSTTT